MRHAELEAADCSVARTWAVLGERWTMLVLRESFFRTRRFEEFQRNLGIARNVLADRLAKLVEEGILDRVRYSERPERFEYRLSQKGRDLYPLLVAAMAWGDRYKVDRPPVVLTHMTCGHPAEPALTCGHCGEALDPREVAVEHRPMLRLAITD